MTELKHTPGPWAVHLGFDTDCGREPARIYTDDGRGNGVAIPLDEDHPGELERREAIANKFLIEAATKLLAALKPLATLQVPAAPQGNAGFYSIRFDDIERARAAIAKATGGGR